ncbi:MULTISPECIES: GNAT family N-acetyltransferase [Actinoalloteichus]|uniref:Acetyltransferase n=1 Tax=Actinoalloteichus fjordicus TaxID=1612552 RepID=A0AAC9PQT9_9PSEU|nr:MULTISPECIES: GNAT family N-acetyltransferase [Actinoalloteichus]APU13415.1 acetyltransferase [Actinoalloteichus fjordicus]APU19365.1 acetyltransferase [Actinoalloteichus sp. GBA129-24]
MSDEIVRPMLASDVPMLVAVSTAAGRLFAEHGIVLPEDDPAATIAEADDVLVADLPSAGPVGFAATTVLDGDWHLAELAVHPAYGRRGIGGSLLRATVDRARRRGFDRVSLTTFADLAFNAPWYAHRGFRVLAERDHGPELAAQRQLEIEAGITVAPRVVMVHDLR